MKGQDSVPTAIRTHPDHDHDWRDTVLDFLGERALSNGTCEKCRTPKIEMAPALVTLARWEPKDQKWTLSGDTYPLAVFVCMHCGHVILYSAALAGVDKENLGPE